MTMGMIRGQELIIILVIVLVLFGASRLPALARSIGQSAKEFRKGLGDGEQAEVTEDQQD
jgi:sec-independent protein translocase protein TatA